MRPEQVQHGSRHDFPADGQVFGLRFGLLRTRGTDPPGFGEQLFYQTVKGGFLPGGAVFACQGVISVSQFFQGHGRGRFSGFGYYKDTILQIFLEYSFFGTIFA